jgi:hypothetical protein
MIQEKWNFSWEVIGMDARTIVKIKPELTRFLHEFDGYFGRVTTRRYLDLYVEGPVLATAGRDAHDTILA